MLRIAMLSIVVVVGSGTKQDPRPEHRCLLGRIVRPRRPAPAVCGPICVVHVRFAMVWTTRSRSCGWVGGQTRQLTCLREDRSI